MRRRHRLIRVACLLVLTATGCKEADKTAPAAAPAPKAAAPAEAATTPAAAPAPALAAAPALPSLGPPPAGMDQLKAFACDKGEAAACLAAAREIEPHGAYRVDMKPEAADALDKNVALYAQRACELGSADACPMASHFSRDGKVQVAALEKGCALGNLSACGTLGWALIGNGKSLDDKRRGLELMDRACRGRAVGYGHQEPALFCEQAIMYYRSKDAEDRPLRDLAKAKELEVLKCQQGNVLDCPCKKDEDCGGGEYFCSENECSMMSPD